MRTSQPISPRLSRPLAALGVAALLALAPAPALAVEPASDPAPITVMANGASGWVRGEDGAWRFSLADGTVVRGWLVTDVLPGESASTGLQRYWLKADGSLATGELIQTGASSWTYARPEGYVVRGKWTDPATGNVYLSDNDGNLASAGWVVSDAYGDGLQRYWVDEVAHACVPGISSAGWAHYTSAAGYVLRGSLETEHGTLIADNDGRLLEDRVAAVDGEGWYVGDLGAGLQRYNFNAVDGHLYARTGVFTATIGGVEARFYASPENGYVVRGATAASPLYLEGAYWSSDNEGRLTQVSVAPDDTPRSRDPWLATVTWGDDASYISTLAAAAARIGSDTDYFISFDNELCRVIVFERTASGTWQATKLWNCHGAKNTYSAANKHIYGWGGVYKISDHQI